MNGFGGMMISRTRCQNRALMFAIIVRCLLLMWPKRFHIASLKIIDIFFSSFLVQEGIRNFGGVSYP